MGRGGSPDGVASGSERRDERTKRWIFVRFDRPVDHEHALITITRGGRVVETLHPRLDSSPDVLFARAPRLPRGDYALHWSVKQMVGTEVTEGNVPFMVTP